MLEPKLHLFEVDEGSRKKRIFYGQADRKGGVGSAPPANMKILTH